MRKELRFSRKADVYLMGKYDKKDRAVLLDLSGHGLSVKWDNYIGILPGYFYTIVIIPEEEADIKEFWLEVESRWVKLNKSIILSGFSIVSAPHEEKFWHYLEYLKKKSRLKNQEINIQCAAAPHFDPIDRAGAF